MMVSVSQQTFTKEVLEASEPVLVHFWAPWCGLCRLIMPVLNKFEADSEGEIKIVEINADNNLRLASTYRLKTLPTIILFEGGRIIHRIEGFQGKEELRRTLENIIVSQLAHSA